MLLWQVLVANRIAAARQDATDALVSAARTDIASLQDKLNSGTDHVTTRIVNLDGALNGLEARLSADIKALPTAAETKKDRDALQAHVDVQVAAVQQAFATAIADLDARSTEIGATQAQRIDGIQVALAKLGDTVASLGTRVDKGIDSGIQKNIDAIQNTLRQETKSFATAAEIAALKKAIIELQEQVSKLLRSAAQTGGEVQIGNKPNVNASGGNQK